MPDTPTLAPDGAPDQNPPPAVAARRLIRGTRAATIATQTGATPATAWVTIACLPDLSLVLLLSDLSRHTRHLRDNPQCNLLLTAPPPPPPALHNPQTTPRISLAGHASITADPQARDRFLRLHPYARQYAGFTDFAVWQVHIDHGHYVAGFAQAHTLSAAQLAPDTNTQTLAAAEPDLLRSCNQTHAAPLRTLGRRLTGLEDTWTLAAIDCDGCDLVGEHAVARIEWKNRVGSAEEFLDRLEAVLF